MKRLSIQGKTLLELMISLAIGLLLTAGVLHILISGRQTYLHTQNLLSMTDTARFAIESMRYQGAQAGYISDPTAATVDEFQASSAAHALIAGQIVGGIDNVTSAQVSSLSADTALAIAAGTDTLLFRFKPSDASFFNCVGQAATPIGSTITNIYYVDVNDRLRCHNGTSSLELAPDVENLQVRYGIDSNGDDAVDSYENSITSSQARDIIAVQVSLLVRSIEDYEDTRNHQFTLFDSVINKNDGYLRQAFTTTIPIHNRLNSEVK